MACRLYTPRIVIGTLLLCVAMGAQAQQDPVLAQFWNAETMYNPAAVGKWDQLNINAALQMHAMGFEDAGSTLYAGADIAFMMGKTRHGVGAGFMSDDIGIFSHKRFSLQYAYQLKMGKGKKHKLSLGVEADMLSESVNGSKADLEDSNDPAFGSSDMTGSRFDLSVGLYYQWKDLSAGLSMTHLTAPTVELGDKNELSYRSHYYLNASYIIRTRNPYFHITPVAMFRTDLKTYRADVGARCAFEREKKNFNFGVDYAPMHSVTVFIGCVFQGINVCYSYEANTEGMGLGFGQHEITLGYRLDLNLGKKGRNMHKTVRWL